MGYSGILYVATAGRKSTIPNMKLIAYLASPKTLSLLRARGLVARRRTGLRKPEIAGSSPAVLLQQKGDEFGKNIPGKLVQFRDL